MEKLGFKWFLEREDESEEREDGGLSFSSCKLNGYGFCSSKREENEGEDGGAFVYFSESTKGTAVTSPDAEERLLFKCSSLLSARLPSSWRSREFVMCLSGLKLSAQTHQRLKQELSCFGHDMGRKAWEKGCYRLEIVVEFENLIVLADPSPNEEIEEEEEEEEVDIDDLIMESGC